MHGSCSILENGKICGTDQFALNPDGNGGICLSHLNQLNVNCDDCGVKFLISDGHAGIDCATDEIMRYICEDCGACKGLHKIQDKDKEKT